MAIYSGLFNSVNGDRKYNAWWFALYFHTFIGNGVFPNPSNNLQVTEYEQMKTTVKPGKGWINGYFIYSDSDHVLEHDRADGVLKRIDRIVMRLDYLEREIDIVIKKGELATNPVEPTLQRDADVYELAIADVFINAGATEITQANITDTRLNNELCGIVHGTVDQVDTTTLYNQYLDFWENWRTGKMDEFGQFLIDSQSEFDNQTIMNQQEFDDWFATIQDILDGNVAGNLLSMIEDIIESKGQPGGIASLDSDGKVPHEQLPPMDYIPTSEKGVPSGVATLGSDGQIPLNQLSNASQLNSGDYVGNSVENRVIDVGFRPRGAIIARSDGDTLFIWTLFNEATIRISGSSISNHTQDLKIDALGFRLFTGSAASTGANASEGLYSWIAWR